MFSWRWDAERLKNRIAAIDAEVADINKDLLQGFFLGWQRVKDLQARKSHLLRERSNKQLRLRKSVPPMYFSEFGLE